MSSFDGGAEDSSRTTPGGAAEDQRRRLESVAKRIRIHVLQMTHEARSSHVGTSLSMADILAVLYGAALRVDPERPDWPSAIV